MAHILLVLAIHLAGCRYSEAESLRGHDEQPSELSLAIFQGSQFANWVVHNGSLSRIRHPVVLRHATANYYQPENAQYIHVEHTQAIVIAGVEWLVASSGFNSRTWQSHVVCSFRFQRRTHKTEKD